MATLSDNLREFIELHEKNISKFAQRTGMKTSTVSNYITGLRLPDACAMTKILDAYPNLSADFLYGRSVPMLLDDRSQSTEASNDSSILVEHINSQNALISQLMTTISDRDELIKKLIDRK